MQNRYRQSPGKSWWFQQTYPLDSLFPASLTVFPRLAENAHIVRPERQKNCASAAWWFDYPAAERL